MLPAGASDSEDDLATAAANGMRKLAMRAHATCY